jgi:hypothetical protein
MQGRHKGFEFKSKSTAKLHQAVQNLVRVRKLICNAPDTECD